MPLAQQRLYIFLYKAVEADRVNAMDIKLAGRCRHLSHMLLQSPVAGNCPTFNLDCAQGITSRSSQCQPCTLVPTWAQHELQNCDANIATVVTMDAALTVCPLLHQPPGISLIKFGHEL